MRLVERLAWSRARARATLVDVADEERDRRVAVHAVEVDGDVDVDDVAVDQRPAVGDAVADDLVDRGADRLGEARGS